jgi:hypothetical protein
MFSPFPKSEFHTCESVDSHVRHPDLFFIFMLNAPELASDHFTYNVVPKG